MVARKRNDIDAYAVREAFSYDEQTGALIWKNSRHLRPHDRARLVGAAAGSAGPDGYTNVKLRGKLYKAHRLIWLHVHGVWPADEIDHVDGDKANNRISNLREASRSENMRNAGAYKNNPLRLRGVSFDRESGKWRAQITLARKTRTLGRFATIEEAHAAYQVAAATVHGGFARQAQ